MDSMQTLVTDDFGRFFPATSGYLAACSAGLPTLETAHVMHTFVKKWSGGQLDLPALGKSLERSRSHFAAIAGVDPDRVAISSQVSQLTSVVATGVPDGGEVLCASQDFASLTHPFEQLARRGVTVRYAPVAELADAIRDTTDLVAFSLVQSATGEVADHAAISAAAAEAGARTLVDLTQSLGWLPVGAANFDFTACHAYKWLCSPRGTAFLTVRDGLDSSLTPIAAGWYSAADVWASCYAGHTPLAEDASCFDLSPAWPSIEGTEAALEFLLALDPTAVHAHAVGLANEARAALGLEVGNSAIVTWADADGTDHERMREAGIVALGRAGNARVAFHLWNTSADVEMLARALRR